MERKVYGGKHMIRLYKLCVPDAMQEHRFTDDVAICWAISKKRAIRKFKRLYDYDDQTMNTSVSRVRFNNWKIAILTDY